MCEQTARVQVVLEGEKPVFVDFLEKGRIDIIPPSGITIKDLSFSEFSMIEDEHLEELNPVVIAETQTKLRSLTVGEAVMQMELEHAPFLMFRNDANGRFNIVFQREDGNIGWVDPDNLAA